MEEKIELFKKLREEYYDIEGNGVGGKLHIVLDDDNYHDSAIQYCKDKCEDDEKGRVICDLLFSIPFERRLWMERDPLWDKDYFNYDYTEVNEEIKPGDYVLVDSDDVIFIAETVGDLVKVKNIDTKYHISVCVKIIISQELS